MNFETWFKENKTKKQWMDAYMRYFYAWSGWIERTNLDPVSYRSWMREQFYS